MHREAGLVRERKQGGVVLVEALIAILLFSLGILALVGLQATMSKNVTHAKLRSEASFLANQVVGQMWVDQANLGKYATADDTCDGYDSCSKWLAAVTQTLPGGSATITVNAPRVDVSLSWILPGQGEVPGRFDISAQIVN